MMLHHKVYRILSVMAL